MCIYVRDRKYKPFVLLSPQVRYLWWVMTFGDNVSQTVVAKKNVACFVALCSVSDDFCSPLPFSLSGRGMPS